MLYCQPNDFYSEMRYISDNRSSFLKQLCLTEYKIPDTVDNIDPLVYLIKMVQSEPGTPSTDRIFALRTYGTYNSLTPKSTDTTMQVYFATISDGCLHISKPDVSYLLFEDDVMYFTTRDEYDDEYQFTIDDIAHDTYQNPYSLYAYVYFNPLAFEPRNLMAKIPVTLLPHLV